MDSVYKNKLINEINKVDNVNELSMMFAYLMHELSLGNNIKDIDDAILNRLQLLNNEVYQDILNIVSSNYPAVAFTEILYKYKIDAKLFEFKDALANYMEKQEA